MRRYIYKMTAICNIYLWHDSTSPNVPEEITKTKTQMNEVASQLREWIRDTNVCEIRIVKVPRLDKVP